MEHDAGVWRQFRRSDNRLDTGRVHELEWSHIYRARTTGREGLAEGNRERTRIRQVQLARDDEAVAIGGDLEVRHDAPFRWGREGGQSAFADGPGDQGCTHST